MLNLKKISLAANSLSAQCTKMLKRNHITNLNFCCKSSRAESSRGRTTWTPVRSTRSRSLELMITLASTAGMLGPFCQERQTRPLRRDPQLFRCKFTRKIIKSLIQQRTIWNRHAAQSHLSSNVQCFLKIPKNLPYYHFISFLPVSSFSSFIHHV